MKKAEEVSISLVDEILQDTPEVFKKQTIAKMLLSKRIYDAYTKIGLNKTQFAELVNKKPNIITRWLSGDHNFEVDTLVEIENALNIKLLFLEEEEKVIQSEISIHFTVVNYKIKKPELPSYMTAYSVVSSDIGTAIVGETVKQLRSKKDKNERALIYG